LPRSPDRLLLLLLVCMATACRGGDERVPTFSVRGEAFFNSQPAEGAIVILRPKAVGDAAAEWPSGFPRAIVQSDGAFTAGTYAAADGAPAGEYVILVQWPTAAADDESTDIPEGQLDDRLQGRYLDPAKSPWSVVVKPEVNDLGRIDLK
jgi:hypothetical protein